MSDEKFLSIKDNPPPVNVELDILVVPMSEPHATPDRLVRMTYRLINDYEKYENPEMNWHDLNGNPIAFNLDVTFWGPTLDLWEYKLK
jgi:hypothetical protein